MNNNRDFGIILRAGVMGFLTYLVFPIVASVISAVLNQDARFDPQRNQSPTVTPSNSIQATNSPTPGSSTQTPLPISTQTPKPEPTISGEWVGTYTCSQHITGVTVKIDQTRNTVIADFYLYPPPENLDIPLGSKRYQGANGHSEYKGNFNATSRNMSFSEGIWRKKPAPFWTAFGFYGEFDDSLEQFNGRMDNHSCTDIKLRRKKG
jgi:hypothetical protein